MGLALLHELPLIGIVLLAQDLFLLMLNDDLVFLFGPTGKAFIEEFDQFAGDNGVGIVA